MPTGSANAQDPPSLPSKSRQAAEARGEVTVWRCLGHRRPPPVPQPSGRPCFLQDRTKPFCLGACSWSTGEIWSTKGEISPLKLYFDTHALVCLLEENGFPTQQAGITASALVKIMDTNMDIVYKDMVTKMQQEIAVQQIMPQIANVKKGIILEKSEFSALRAENEKINPKLHQLKQVMDEVIKVQT
ncbi:hypothetical protein GH733_001419, partial [Mirounga leonina]